MADVSIRMASVNDAPRLLEIYAYYVEETAISFEYDVPSLQEFQGRIARILQRHPYLVAELDGEILGYAYAMGICAVIIVDVTFVVNANHVEGTCEGVGIARINGSVLFVTPEEASRGLFGHVFLCREAIVETLVAACEILSRIIVGQRGIHGNHGITQHACVRGGINTIKFVRNVVTVIHHPGGLSKQH